MVALSEGGSGAEFRAGAAIVLWLAVILGLVLGLWPRATIPRPAIAASLCLAALAGLTGLSISWATDNGHAFIELVRVLTYLGLFVCVVLASSAGGARPWLVGLALGAAAIACIAVVSPAVPWLFEGARELRIELGTARLSFPTGYWNGLGLVMAMGILLFTWLSAEGRTRLSRSLACAAIAVAGPALAFTFSRGSLVALGLGLVVLVALGRSRPVLVGSLTVGALGAGAAIGAEMALLAGAEAGGGTQGGTVVAGFVGFTAIGAAAAGLVRWALDRRLGSLRAPSWALRAVLAGMAVVAVLGLVLVNPLEHTDTFCEAPQGERFSSEASDLATRFGNASSSGRCQFWEAGLEAFASAPISGVGAAGFESWWAEHHTIAQPASLVHSLWIGTAAQLGIGGLLITVLFIALAVAAGVRARSGRLQGSVRAAALAVFLAGLFSASIDWMWELPAGFGPVVLAAALLTGPALCAPAERSRSRFGLGVAALVVGWFTVVAALLSLFGEHKVAESTRLLEDGREAAAIEAADTAATLVPWSAEPYLLKAAALEQRGQLEAAGDAIDEALERAPGDWRMWSVAARIELAEGDAFVALAALSEANRRNPFVEPLGEGR